MVSDIAKVKWLPLLAATLALLGLPARASAAPLAVYAGAQSPADADPAGLPFRRTDSPFARPPLPFAPQVLWVKIEPSDLPPKGEAAIEFRSTSTDNQIFIPGPARAYERIVPTESYLALPRTNAPIYARTTVTLNRIPQIVPLVQAEHDQQEFLTWSQFFVGFFLAIGLFNLLLYVVLRDPPFLWYAGIMASMIGIEIVTTPLVHRQLESFGPAGPPVLRILSLWAYFACITFFSRSFLRIRRYMPALDLTLFILLALNVVFIAAESLLNELWPLAWLDDALLGALLLALLLCGVLMYRRGDLTARYYIIAFAGAALGIIINDIATSRLLLHASWLVYSLQIGIAWEAIFLAVAMADRTHRIAVENEQLGLANIQAEILASQDGLTGVANRRAFDLAFANAWRTAVRANETLGVIILDVDDFKHYNDTHGHLAGDDVLRSIAHTCEDCSRRGVDTFARYGGEEFSAVLPRASEKDALAVAERMRASVQALGIGQRDGTPVTISVGIAILDPAKSESPDALLNKADEALYAAKSQGKNRTIIALFDGRTN